MYFFFFFAVCNLLKNAL